jgi:DNA (cytosine-5)-methyltransferase 1
METRKKDLNKMTIKAVELFAGIGGFRLACDQLGIKTIWANDIDDNASKIYQKNFNSGIFVQDDIIKQLDSIPNHQLLTAGLPCQPFSSAGKKKGISDPRGTLFELLVQILKTHSPTFFVLENVKRLLSMAKGLHFATILDSLSSLDYLIEWRLLNAIDFGLPQHRERVILIGSKNPVPPKSFLCSHRDISVISTNQLNQIARVEKWTNIIKHDDKFPNWGLSYHHKFIGEHLTAFSAAQKSVRLKEIIQKQVDPAFDFTRETLTRLKSSQRVEKYYNGVEIVYNQKGGARMGYTIFGINGVAPTLTSSTSRHYERYQIGSQYRRLTPIEYARIQGFPDNHCEGVSVYDQYALYGNAVPPPMVKWVINRLITNQFITINDLNNQMELF